MATPFDATGKLLPEITARTNDAVGAADKRVQAYNFRMCFSDDPARQVAFPKPPGYTRHRYELLARLLKARTAAEGKFSIDVRSDVYKLDVTGPPGGKLIAQWASGRLSSGDADLVDVRSADADGIGVTMIKGVLLSGEIDPLLLRIDKVLDDLLSPVCRVGLGRLACCCCLITCGGLFAG